MIIPGIIASSLRTQIVATGGSITTYNGYRVHTFTSSGIFSISSGLDAVEYDLLASGGGGGCDHNGSGGGGAGGRSRGVFIGRQATYVVTIGAAGTGGPSHSSPGTSASTSYISGIPVFYTEVYGGGRGGAYANAGFNGGCGGGGGFYQPGGLGLLGQGFNGAWGYLYSGGGGGGQGSDGVAGSAAGFPTYSGAGGTGANVPDPSWLSSVVSRGGGGAGGGGDYGGSSSSGGGIGRGLADPSYVGGNGLANYGAGGGGGRDVGGNGGSGICYFRYKIY